MSKQVIDTIEESLRNLTPVAFNKFSVDKFHPRFTIERLDKKEIRPGSMQVSFPCVKILVTVPGNPEKKCYLLYRTDDDGEGIIKQYYNGKRGKYGVLDSEELSEDSINVFRIASDLAVFIEHVVIPLRILSIGGM